MNKEFCDKLIEKRKQELTKRENKLPELRKRLTDSKYKNILNDFDQKEYNLVAVSLSTVNGLNRHNPNHPFTKEDVDLMYDIVGLQNSEDSIRFILQDSDVKRYDGDVVITDPCFFMTNHPSENEDDAFCALDELCNKNLTHTSIYGDWECAVEDKDSGKQIGYFSAENAEVGVFLLKDVLEFNPNFVFSEESHCVALLKDFHGDIQIVIDKEKDNEEYFVHVVGNGNVKFDTYQIWF